MELCLRATLGLLQRPGVCRRKNDPVANRECTYVNLLEIVIIQYRECVY